MTSNNQSPELVELTAGIVSAYVSNNAVAATEMPSLIEKTFGALRDVSARNAQSDQQDSEPAVPVKKSVTPDAIICLECGRKFKSLKRHIKSEHELTPQDYREKWRLSYDYPVVAPTYAAARSKLAKKIGLGRKNKD